MRARVRFTGRVQGVGFRATTRDAARRTGVAGWVRNEADGSVLAELQGSPEAVRAVISEVRSVFRRNLEGLDEASIADVAGETDFEVRR